MNNENRLHVKLVRESKLVMRVFCEKDIRTYHCLRRLRIRCTCKENINKVIQTNNEQYEAPGTMHELT